MEINLKQLLENGCRFIIIDEKKYFTKGCILVKDVKEMFTKTQPLFIENISLSLLLELLEQMEKQLIKNLYIVYFHSI